MLEAVNIKKKKKCETTRNHLIMSLTSSAFKVIEGTHAFGQKFVYFLGQLVNIALALYKCQSMGLLPTHASDWLAFVEPQARVEYSGGGFMYI